MPLRPQTYMSSAFALLPLFAAEAGQPNPRAEAQAGRACPTGKTTPAKLKPWKIKMWPTEAIVDLNGTLRALALQPDYLERVLDALLMEQP